jgi:hypothetical protein
MYCSRSVSIHLLRGLGAASLLAAAFIVGNAYIWLVPPLLVGAVILLRGCPACWLIGLFETLGRRREADHPPAAAPVDRAIS